MDRPVRPRLSRASLSALALFIACLVIALAGSKLPGTELGSRLLPSSVTLRAALKGDELGFLRQAYAHRHYEPIWIHGEQVIPAASQLIEKLQTSDQEGLSPDDYSPSMLRERVSAVPRSSRRERIRTEILLSTAYVRYIRDLHTPSSHADLHFTDPGLQPVFREPEEIAVHLARSHEPKRALEQSTRMNVLYSEMRAALGRYRGSVKPRSEVEAILLLNLDRLRGLPGDLGARFVLVNAASNQLWLYEHGKPVDGMKVIVGAPNQQTPQLAGVIRYAMFNPYWNVPPDMTRDTYAPRVLVNPNALADLNMEAWSGFGADARRIDPNSVDWGAIAEGRTVAWLRQRPGPNNSMGRVKFMLPNKLGIYLHDTPQKQLFSLQRRFLSAGCVRVEDSVRLSDWLYEGAKLQVGREAADQRFDLPKPTPVYILYLSVSLDGDEIDYQQDAYGRDRGAVERYITLKNLGPADL